MPSSAPHPILFFLVMSLLLPGCAPRTTQIFVQGPPGAGFQALLREGDRRVLTVTTVARGDPEMSVASTNLKTFHLDLYKDQPDGEFTVRIQIPDQPAIITKSPAGSAGLGIEVRGNTWTSRPVQDRTDKKPTEKKTGEDPEAVAL